MSTRPISILYFTNTGVRGGAEDHILTLLAGLDRRLFRPSLVCPPELARKLEPDMPHDVQVRPLLFESPAQVRAAWQFARILRALRVDILHAHMFQSSLVASPIGWLCRVPVIIETSHGREAWRRGWLKGRFLIDRLVGRAVDHYIAVSQATARYLIGQKGLPARKISVIRSAADLTHYHPEDLPPEGLRSSLGFAESDPVLLVAGRLEAQKGHRVLIAAMPAVRAQFPRVRLVCLSDGSLRGDLERQVRELGLQDCVRFVGRQPKLTDWLALADVTVLPSFFEGLPLAAIESLAAGKPMVATAVDGTPEVILDGKTGLTVPSGDAESLAQAVCRLLADPALRGEMGRAGRRFVLEEYSQEKLLRDTTELYLRAWRQRLRALDPSGCQEAGARPRAASIPDGSDPGI